MVDVSRLDPRVAAMVTGLRERFPQVTLTSGFRDPSRNAAVGGAKGSQHLHGNAFDFSVRGLPEDQQLAILQYLREQGAQGFGYYPDSQSIHADIGAARAWGPDKTSASLNRTPTFFQKFVGVDRPVQVAELPPVQPAAASSPTAEKPVYSPDLFTQARAFGNQVLPDVIDAPKPMTPEEVKTMQADMAKGGEYMKAAQGLMSLSSLLMPKPEEEMPMQAPQINRGQFRPLPRMRGLLG